MTRPPPRRDRDPGCPVCRDEGDVGEVLEPPDASGTALVRTEGGLQEVAADLVEGLEPGHRVLLHLGFVLAVVEPGDGRRETAEERAAAHDEDEDGKEEP